jgi:hypothetical protein
MRRKNLYFSIFAFLTSGFVFSGLMILSCASNQVKYTDPVEMLYDNFWINENTLQIQVEYSSPEIMPYTMRRESSCGKAKELIDARLYALYPSIKTMAYKINIYKTMYHKKADCRLVVHVSMPELKNTLQKSKN